MMKPYELMSEAELQEAVARYLVTEYPEVMFHSDYGAGTKLTFNQAKRQKRQNGGRRAWPDMFIAQKAIRPYITRAPKTINKHPNCQLPNAGELFYYGLFLELKKDGERLLAVPGRRRMYHYVSEDGKEYKDQHTMEQADCLYKLRERGYCAEFAVGFEEAKRIIDEYLGGVK